MDGGTFIGFGEAARAFATDARWTAHARGYDLKSVEYAGAGVIGCVTLAEALHDATIILSLVTADQSLLAAQGAAQYLSDGAYYFDMNSVAPATKQAAAAAIEGAGGHYLDVAVMSPVYPAQLAVPLLVSGKLHRECVVTLTTLGFTNVRSVGDGVGRASTIKMLRSVMYKGVEALTAECLLACDKAGVTDEVLGSFATGVGSDDWAAGADYRLDRMMVHGVRRSAEMAEVVKTLAALGVDPLMTRGTVIRQYEIGARGIKSPPATLNDKLERLKS